MGGPEAGCGVCRKIFSEGWLLVCRCRFSDEKAAFKCQRGFSYGVGREVAVALRHLGRAMTKQCPYLIKRCALFHMPAGKRMAQAVKDNALPPIRISVVETERVDTALKEFGGLNALASSVCRKDEFISGLSAEAPTQHGTDLRRHVRIAIIAVLGVPDKDFSAFKADISPVQGIDFSGTQAAEKR